MKKNFNLFKVGGYNMAEFISFVSPGSYEIDFKTSDYSEYRKIEDAARGIIDKNTTKKTYSQDFLEKFPNATFINGSIASCRAEIYGENDCECSSYENCDVCWNSLM